ncbi:protein kinase A regulatory subunit [Cavenderia fasciculata]|uniref:Protein kinase A regulatory subunit n=1 Tax=Cavenderia fasciculata TaxID=261658 RepID=F4PKV0_CACFS|nr:protein kinase A regulatory subunit [Cavenderia fasciculata]EGG24224.1 protein kinase A regulatory subunit [Cavenderia fasciculata]|eukprot:XP_004362075.1 protein kinase A regulatory subunit [Cavenderia fasciculata]
MIDPMILYTDSTTNQPIILFEENERARKEEEELDRTNSTLCVDVVSDCVHCVRRLSKVPSSYSYNLSLPDHHHHHQSFIHFNDRSTSTINIYHHHQTYNIYNTFYSYSIQYSTHNNNNFKIQNNRLIRTDLTESSIMTSGSNHQQKATEKVNSSGGGGGKVLEEGSVVQQQQQEFVRKRRGAISSEVMGDSTQPAKAIPIAPKTAEAQLRLKQALQRNILFNHLEDEERNTIFSAMVEVHYKENDLIIKQGDQGDNFYVVDDGICDIYVTKDPNTFPGIHVMEVRTGGSFGELALIHGTPRAATVIARTNVRLWAIDRITYKRILMDATIHKRDMYKKFLKKVYILKDLEKYERNSLADALEPVSFKDGEVIVRQGEKGDKFYIIVDGEVRVTQREGGPTSTTGPENEVARLHPSEYFGEIALLTDRPRAATVTSVGTTKCVEMDRQRFTRLLGPCENILRRNMEMYNQFINPHQYQQQQQQQSTKI